MLLNRYKRPLKNAPFCPISASDSKFNPRNITNITPDKFFVFLELEQKLTFFKGLFRVAILGVGILFSALFGPAFAGEADVTAVKVTAEGNGTYRFDVTVLHADTGWDHYANKWEVVLPNGTIAATRTLFHPHVSEQPFTRSLSGVKLPDDIDSVTIQAHDSVHGYGGKIQEIQLP